MKKTVFSPEAFGLTRRQFFQAMSAGLGGALVMSRLSWAAQLAAQAGETVIPPPPIQYNPVLHIAQNYTMNGAIEFINDENVEDNVWSRWLEQNMGLRYDVAWAASGTEAVTQQWSTTLASGELPEYMVYLSGDTLRRLLEADQFEDITDIWERVASPLLKEKKGYPDGILWRPFLRDGRVRVIPISDAEIATNDSLLWLRKDWLEQLGAQPPTTLDELADLAQAFKDAGLAQIGISITNDSGDVISASDYVFGAFDSMPNFWRMGADGKLVYGSIQPQTKDALAYLNGWYNRGLLDPEFVTKDGDATIEDITTGRAGITSGSLWLTIWPLQDTKITDPNANWAFYEIPGAADGRRGRRGHWNEVACAFRKGIDPQKVEAVIQELNWAFERRANWVANHDYHNAYGPMFEGYDFVTESDTTSTGPTPVAGPWAYAGCVQGNPAAYPYTDMLNDYNNQLNEIATRGEATWTPVERWLVADPALQYQRDAYTQSFSTLDQRIEDQFYSFLTPIMAENMTSLTRMQEEVFLGIINGSRPIDDFDRFVSDWLAGGGQDVTNEVNAWLEDAG